MESDIFWLYDNPESKKKTREILKEFLLPGSIDELRLGNIQEIFSNYFFPGINTQQTTLKYFILLPLLYNILKKGNYNELSDISDKFTELEVKLCNLLCKKYPKDKKYIIGNISIPRYGKMTSYASLRYWVGLYRWGITKDITDSDINKIPAESYISQEYFFNLILEKKEVYNKEEPQMDPSEHINDYFVLADPGSVLTNEKKLKEYIEKEEFDFYSLTPQEIDFILNYRWDSSMKKGMLFQLIELSKSEKIELKVNYLWDVMKKLKKRKLLHSEDEELINHAKLFSFYSKGAVFYYKLVLLEMGKDSYKKYKSNIQKKIRVWYQESNKSYLSWDLKDFKHKIKKIAHEQNRDISKLEEDCEFIEKFFALVRQKNIDFVDNPRIKDHIREREKKVKKEKSRIKNDKRSEKLRERWLKNFVKGKTDYNVDDETDMGDQNKREENDFFQYDYRFRKAKEYSEEFAGRKHV